MFIDIETGGLDPQRDAICSVGYYIQNRKTKAVERKYSALVQPYEYLGMKRNYSDKAMEVNGLSVSELIQGGKGLYDVLYEFIKDSATVSRIWAHNVNFDRSFLMTAIDRSQRGLKPHGEMVGKRFTGCSRKLLREFNPDLASYSLENACEQYELDYGAHEALGDAKSCMLLVNKIRELQKR